MPTPMRVVSLVTQKGGSGKTTLCLNLAVAAEQAGVRCLIVDLDPQGTAEAWYQDREAATPRLVRGEAADLGGPPGAGGGRGFAPVLTATRGGPERAGAAGVRPPDFCPVPCGPPPADMKAHPTTAAPARRLGKPMAFVLTQ